MMADTRQRWRGLQQQMRDDDLAHIANLGHAARAARRCKIASTAATVTNDTALLSKADRRGSAPLDSERRLRASRLINVEGDDAGGNGSSSLRPSTGEATHGEAKWWRRRGYDELQRIIIVTLGQQPAAGLHPRTNGGSEPMSVRTSPLFDRSAGQNALVSQSGKIMLPNTTNGTEALKAAANAVEEVVSGAAAGATNAADDERHHNSKHHSHEHNRYQEKNRSKHRQHQLPPPPQRQGRRTGLTEYRLACCQLGTHLVTRVIAQLGVSDGQMRGLALGPLGGAALAAALGANDVVTSLDISDNGLGVGGMGAILRALLESNVTVSRLDVSENRMDEEAVVLLARRVTAACGRMHYEQTVCDGSDDVRTAADYEQIVCGTGDDQGVEGGGLVAQTQLQPQLKLQPEAQFPISQLPPLEHVSLDHCHVGDKALRHLTLALEKDCGLTSFRPTQPGRAAAAASHWTVDASSLLHNQPATVVAAAAATTLARGGATVTAGSRELTKQHTTELSTPIVSFISSKVTSSSSNYLASSSSSLPAISRGVDLAPQLPLGLTRLSLAGNLIGDVGAAHIGRALGVNRALTWLNLSWNRIGSTGAVALADGLRVNQHLASLSLAWNGLEDRGGWALGEMLACNTGLRKLDMSNCRLGAEACTAIARAFSMPGGNSTLSTLRLDHNPCGQEGGRSLVAAIAGHPLTLSLEGCAFIAAAARSPQTTSTSTTTGSWPGGKTENSAPGKSSRRGGVSEDQSCQAVEATPRTSGRGSASSYGVNTLPGSRITFKTTGDNIGEGQVCETPLGHLPPPMTAAELQALVGQLGTNRLSDFEQLRQLEMFLRPHRLTMAQARQVMSAFGGVPGPERLTAAVAMHARLTDPDDIHRLFDFPREYWRLRDSLSLHVHFRTANPTGRYALNLAVAVDRTVAQRLVDAALAESSMVGGNVSIVGGNPSNPVAGNCWRNVRVNSRPWISSTALTALDIQTGIPQPWLLADEVPNHGTLEFDFVSSVEPPNDAAPLSNIALEDLLLARGVAHRVSGELMNEGSLWFPASGAAHALCALREASPKMWITAQQARRVVSIFESGGGQRVEAAVTLFARTVPAASRFRLLRGLDAVEQCHLGYRLGWARLVGCKDPPPTARYRLDLSRPDDASFTKRVVAAATREKGAQCMHNVVVNGRRLPMVTDSTLWTVVATETKTPLLEFDLFSPGDIWEVVVAELGDEYLRANRNSGSGGNKLPSPGALVRLASLLSFRRAYNVHEAWTRLAPVVSGPVGASGVAGRSSGSAVTAGGQWVRTTEAVLRRSANPTASPAAAPPLRERRTSCVLMIPSLPASSSTSSSPSAPRSKTQRKVTAMKNTMSKKQSRARGVKGHFINESATQEGEEGGGEDEKQDEEDDEGQEDSMVPGMVEASTAAELQHLGRQLPRPILTNRRHGTRHPSRAAGRSMNCYCSTEV